MGRVIRLLVIAAIGVSFAVLFALGDKQHTITPQAKGERWYRIEQNGRHLGFMHNTHAEQTQTTHINYRAPEAPPVVIHQRLQFADQPPFSLQRAAYSQRIGDQYSVVSVHKVGADPAHRYTATILRNNSVNQTEFTGSLKLADLYSVERWLQSDPELGSTLRAPYPDFEKLQVSYREHRLLNKDSEGYELTGASPDSITQTRLDRNFMPIKLTMAGRYDVRLSNQESAVPQNAITKLPQPATQKFGLDQALSRRHELEALELTVLGITTLPGTIVTQSGGLSASSATALPLHYVGEHIDYPIHHPKVQRLLMRFERSSDELVTAHNLVAFTHGQLNYVEHQYAGTVLTALELRRGECTDFADLYTTLARSLGLPARTVYGLAYDGEGSPGFRFHAWNEVYANDRWHSIDATWNQVSSDATHIPLSDGQYADLLRLREGQPLAFQLQAAHYRTAPTP